MATPKIDCYENNTITAIPIINIVQAEFKYEDFMEEFDGNVVSLNDKVREDAKKLFTAKKLTSDELQNYIQSNTPMSTDIYKFLAADIIFKDKFVHSTFNVKC